MRRVGIALVLAGALALPRAALAESWATAQARQLTDQGDRLVARGEVEAALGRFTQALDLDGSYGPAYLALARARLVRGDPAEADRVLSQGISRVMGFAEGFMARARLRLGLGRRPEAARDAIDAARLASDDPRFVTEAEALCVEAGALPAALGLARQIVALTAGDPEAHAAALLRARALMAVVAEVDPVAGGERGRGEVRAALSRYARGPR